MIERKIIIGLITSTDYIRQVIPILEIPLLKTQVSKLIAQWSIEYYEQYKKAPKRQIELIFAKKVKEGLQEDLVEEIEEDILPALSEEYDEEGIDVPPLYDATLEYMQQNKFLQLSEELDVLLTDKKGDLKERLDRATQLYEKFKKIQPNTDDSIDLSNKEHLDRIKQAFESLESPIIHFPKQLGKFWNTQWVRGAFIAFLAPEKRGKTFLLMYIALLAVRQKLKVAFFQAGDMNEASQLRRIAISITRTNTIEEYCEEHYEPTRDCILNQLNDCDRKERECDFGVFESLNKDEVHQLTKEQIIEAYEDMPDYTPCYNCKVYDKYRLGAVWVRKVNKKEPLDTQEAIQAIEQFFVKNKRRLKISTHANSTLSISDIEDILDKWEDAENFTPDIILIDYADILRSTSTGDVRQSQNEIWKGLRKLSQTHRRGVLPIVVTPTQADSKSYSTNLLSLDNFSEDKRKYGHVTAFYGLNIDKEGREKELGLLRINELIIREGAFSNNNHVTILQNLRQGRPVIASYFQKKVKSF